MQTTKHYSAFFLLALSAIICSCVGQNTTSETATNGTGRQTFSFKDSCQHLVVSLSVELPMGEDSVSAQIRDSLIADFIFNMKQPGYDQEGESGIEPYDGDMNDAQSIVNYYGKAAYDELLEYAMSDYDARMEYLDEDTTMTSEEREEIKSNVPQWQFDFNLSNITDTLGFVVYQSQAYVYYGGAHGGVTGSGALTFDKSTGRKIARFVKSDAADALLPQIRKGLIQYFCECGDTITDEQLNDNLLIDGIAIPLPADTPYPNATGDSLIFTYRQYEIAPYAAGMPSFMLSTRDLMPHLTPEGKALFEKR